MIVNGSARHQAFRVACLMVACALSTQGYPTERAGMPWAADYGSALTSIKASGKLLLVDFYADWCTWCKRLDRDTFTDRKVIALGGKVVPLRLNVEKDGKAVASRYGVQNLPRVLLIDAKGQIWCSIQGYLPPATFAAEISKGINAKGQYAQAKRVLQARPQDVRAIATVAYVEAQRGRIDQALALLAGVGNGQLGGQMAAALNACGEALFRKGLVETAAKLYRQAERVSNDAYEDAYARVSLAYCLQRSGDRTAARTACELVLKTPGAPSEFVSMANDILLQLSKKGGS